MGTLRKVKNALRFDKELRPLLVHATLHEVTIDLDGDKVAEIALIDASHDGDIDTIAIDVTGTGTFNIYLSDTDGNGIPDAVQFYDDVDDMPVAAYFGRRVEEHMISLAVHIHNSIVAGEIVADELLKVLEELEAEAEKEYAKVQENTEKDAEAETTEEAAEEPEGKKEAVEAEEIPND